MDANWAKRLYETMPRRLKFALAPVLVNRFLENPVFRQTWEQIEAFKVLGEDDRSARQFALLKDTLIYAYSNVPFYRRRFDEAGFEPKAMVSPAEISALPLLEKADAIRAGEDLYSVDRALDYYETFTGGSSGQALRVLLDKDSIFRERAFVTNFLAEFGYDPKTTRSVAFFGHGGTRDYYYSPLKNEIVISPFRLFDDSQIEAICTDIKRFGAKFLLGYPSAIALLARRVKSHGINLRFNQVVFYAENHSADDKAVVEEAFGCGVTSYYGHTERSVFAAITDAECLFSDCYGYTELVPDVYPNEYRIVCTGFISRKMPLIRYATDDHVVVDASGRMHLVGHKRSDVFLIARNGARVFKGAMTLHGPELSNITCYQYYQEIPGRATLRLVADRPLSLSKIEGLRAQLDRRTEGLLDVAIEYVDAVELTPGGKLPWAICEVPGE